mmetsp:Transcript_21541/g.38393  ORF Transcript_21541/g.38393 Transcript_21541/m.38393 type:complete len:238 (-) Transcript_21541:760-1473(-)
MHAVGSQNLHANDVPALRAQCPQAQGVELDEARGIVLIVQAAVVLEGGDLRVVQRVGRFAADHGDGALVQLQTHAALHLLLSFVHHRLQGNALGGVPEAVVDHLCVLRHHLILQVHLTAVEAHGLDAAVRGHEDGAAGCLIHATRLHPNETRLYEIEATNAVGASQLVQLSEQLRGRVLHVVDGHGIALLEVDGDVGGFVGCRLGRHTACVHVVGGLHPRVLKRITLVRSVQKIGIH